MKLDSNVVIVTSGAGNKMFIQKFAMLIRNIFERELVLISTGDFSLDQTNFVNIEIKHIHLPHASNPLSRVLTYVLSQFLIVRAIPKNTEIALFFLAQSLIIPMIWLKLRNKKIFLVLGSSNYRLSKSKRGITVFLPFLEKLSFRLADYILLYSNSMKKECNLQNYEKKIKIAHRHFLDFKNFNYVKHYEKREKIVGFIGRLSAEKGVINFIKSIPLILEKDPEIRFLIIGDGILRYEVENLLSDLHINEKVRLINRVSFKKIPSYLNEIKLLVLPSYTEGLPNVVIEAMACGTPVLATSVGAIPDIIIDGKTGFIINNNTPSCIAVNVLKIMDNKVNLELINYSIKFVSENFNYEKVFNDYKKVFSNIK